MAITFRDLEVDDEVYVSPGTPLPVTLPAGALSVADADAQVLSNSESTTNLGSSATFTGTARDAGATIKYRRFVAFATSAQAGTLNVQQSFDNATWFTTHTAAVSAGGFQFLDAPVVARYQRVLYVNGAGAQTTFRIASAQHK